MGFRYRQLLDGLAFVAVGYEVALVRHGEAYCNVNGLIAGGSCQGLTAVGGHQANQVARRFLVEHSAGQPIVQLHTSPVRRAVQTARAVSALTGAEPVVQHDLRVPDPGPVDGQPWEAVRRQHGSDPDRPSRPLAVGGERWRDYLARAHGCLADILNSHPGGRVVIVGHHETLTAALTLLINADELGALGLTLHHTGITRLIARGEPAPVHGDRRMWRLSVHNDAAHLEHRFLTMRSDAM